VDLPRIGKKYVHIPATATLADGSPATLTGMDVAFLEPEEKPVGATVWEAADYADGEGVILVAGPDADPTGALQVLSKEVDVWIRITDSPEVDAKKVGRITIQ
jgi:hypothetical protein